MYELIWLVIALVAVGFVAFVALLVFRGRLREQKTDYRAYFILGICFFPLGIIWLVKENLRVMGIAYLGIGVAFLSIGLANKDKWEKKRKET